VTDHRALFVRAAEHAARFRNEISDRPPRPTIDAAALEARFGGPTPAEGEDPLAVIDALAAAAEPGLSGTTGNRFFGWVIGASHPVGVAADMLTAAWGQNAGNYVAAPAAAMAEKVASRWLLDLLRLPPQCSVGFATGATMANFICLAAARNAVLAKEEWDVEADGLMGAPRVRVYVGADAHTTIFSALRYLGFGSKVTVVPADDQGRMDPEALAIALWHERGPAIVVAQAGQINTGAFDPFSEIARACRRHGAWLHVDGAFGLWARAVPELSDLTLGLDQADSWAVDGHKWLQLPYDSGFAVVRDREAHRRAMGVGASYLPSAAAAEYDPAQYVPELSRRARGFAAWAVIRALGREGIVEMVRRHCGLAQRLAARLSAESGVAVLNDVELNQVIVAFGEGTPHDRDLATRAVIARLASDNLVLVGGAEWRGRHALRFSLIAGPLAEADVDHLAGAVIAAWREVRAADEEAAPTPGG